MLQKGGDEETHTDEYRVRSIHDTEESCCRSEHFIESLRNVAEVRSFVDLHLTHYVEYLTDVAKQVSYEILSYDNSFHNISNLIYFLKCIFD